MSLSREQILAAQDLITDYVDVPAWGGQVKVRAVPMAHPEYIKFVNKMVRVVEDKRRPAEVYPPSPDEREQRKIVGGAILGAIDEEGNQLFTWADADELRKKYWWAICDVAAKAFELAGREETTVGDVDEGKESSETDPISD